MTVGFITPDQEPALRLEVIGPESARSLEAIIDTGFNGGLALPPGWIETLGLPRAEHEQMVLANGSVTGTDLFWGFSLFIEFWLPFY